MSKVLKNKRLIKLNQYDIPQETVEISEELRIPRYHVNNLGSKGFYIVRIKESKERFQVLHRRFGSIANEKTHINDWNGTEVKQYFHNVFHYQNRSEDPQEQYKVISREKWFTPKDIDIVMAIYYHRILTTSQLTELGFYSSKSAARLIKSRCKRLRDNFVIDSFQPAVDNVVGASENHYMLNEVGAYVVADYLEKKNIKEIGWTPRHNEIMMHNIYHTIEINNIFTAFRKEATLQKQRINRHLTSEEYQKSLDDVFQVEKTIAEYLITEQLSGSDGGKIKFNPDGLMILKYNENSVPFFIEVDRNTMQLYDFAAKIPRYEAYARSRLWEAPFGGFFPKILVCTTDERRMIELARTVQDTLKVKALNWYFTTIEKVKDNPYGSIWIKATEAKQSEFNYVDLIEPY
ncbi:MAG: hypothetical protein JWM44_2110 [Bacilli bacterium]|nr:hypothetical protein [Bacilli bacterium]